MAVVERLVCNTSLLVVALAVVARFMVAAVPLVVFWTGRKASNWRPITMSRLDWAAQVERHTQPVLTVNPAILPQIRLPVVAVVGPKMARLGRMADQAPRAAAVAHKVILAAREAALRLAHKVTQAATVWRYQACMPMAVVAAARAERGRMPARQTAVTVALDALRASQGHQLITLLVAAALPAQAIAARASRAGSVTPARPQQQGALIAAAAVAGNVAAAERVQTAAPAWLSCATQTRSP